MKDAPSVRRALSIAVGSAPTRAAVRVVVDRAHRMACAYLRQQQQTGNLRLDVLGEDVADLALDAIAGLFERDEDGEFPELQRYFADRDVAAMSPSALERDLRRLVLSTVTDWCFEAYRTADRSLSNLLRTLKRIAGERDDVRLQRRGETLWLVPSPSSPSTNGHTAPAARRMPMDVLEAHLTGAVADADATADLLDAAVRTLRRHPRYEAEYPLTKLAQVVRSAQVRVQAVTDHAPPVSTPDGPPLRPDEIEDLLEHCLDQIRDEKRSTYVDTDKLDASTYRAYIRALHTRLRARFVPDTEDRTHYEALSAHLPSLSKAQYREAHRARFEYLVQQAESKLTARLRALPR